MEEVVFKLAFVDEVLALATNALQFALAVDLPESGLRVVFSDSEMVVDRHGGVLNDIFDPEGAKLFPFVERSIEYLLVAQGADHVVVFGLGCQFLREQGGDLWRRHRGLFVCQLGFDRSF